MWGWKKKYDLSLSLSLSVSLSFSLSVSLSLSTCDVLFRSRENSCKPQRSLRASSRCEERRMSCPATWRSFSRPSKRKGLPFGNHPFSNRSKMTSDKERRVVSGKAYCTIPFAITLFVWLFSYVFGIRKVSCGFELISGISSSKLERTLENERRKEGNTFRSTR